MAEDGRIDSEGNVEKVVADHSSLKKKDKKKKKSRENKDSFAGEDGEKLDEDAIVSNKSKKQRVNPEAEDDVKKSKKKNKEISTDDDGQKKSKKKNKEISVDSEADDDRKKKNKEKRVDSETDDGDRKKSKKKSKEIRDDLEADDDVKDKKRKKKSGGDEIGSSESSKVYEDSEGNRRAEKSLVNIDNSKRKTGKRKRDDNDLGAEENTENSIKEMKRKIKKKKSNVDSEVEEKSLNSAKDAKKKSKEKKPSTDPEIEENTLNSTKDAKKKRKEDSEAEEKNNGGTKDAKKKSKKKQNSGKDVTTPSSKSTKKVKFSDQVEVFPTEDEDEEEVVELVRGKRYSKEENELIKKAVLEYIDNHALGDEGLKMVMECQSHPQVKGCWKEIASALPWRPLESVYLRAHAIFEAGSKGIWTKEDLELVKQYQEKHGNSWRPLADAMGKHRSHVKDAWRRSRLNKKSKGHWSREEYQSLFDLVNSDLRKKAQQEKHSKHGMLRDNIPWMAISDELSTRDHVVCCLKWYSQLLSPMVAKGEWANVDDYRLLEELLNLDAACIDDVDWDNLLDNRDGEACRKRWNQMVHHIGSPETKTFAEQVEILSQRYCPDIAQDREDFDNRPFDPED